MRSLAPLFALAAACAAAPVTAQMQPDFTQIGQAVNAIAWPVTMNMCNAGLCGPQKASKSSGRPGVPQAFIRKNKPLPAGAPLTAGSYQPTPALAKQTVSGYVQRLRRTKPQIADQFARELGRNDYQKIYASAVRDNGFGSNTLSDAMASYLMLTWLIANNDIREPTQAEVTGIRRQFAALVAGNPTLLAHRADLGEELKLLFVTVQAGFQSARREGTLPRYSDGVAAMIRSQYDLDLRALRLTTNGLTTRS